MRVAICSTLRVFKMATGDGSEQRATFAILQNNDGTHRRHTCPRRQLSSHHSRKGENTEGRRRGNRIKIKGKRRTVAEDLAKDLQKPTNLLAYLFTQVVKSILSIRATLAPRICGETESAGLRHGAEASGNLTHHGGTFRRAFFLILIPRP